MGQRLSYLFSLLASFTNKGKAFWKDRTVRADPALGSALDFTHRFKVFNSVIFPYRTQPSWSTCLSWVLPSGLLHVRCSHGAPDVYTYKYMGVAYIYSLLRVY